MNENLVENAVEMSEEIVRGKKLGGGAVALITLGVVAAVGTVGGIIIKRKRAKAEKKLEEDALNGEAENVTVDEE